MIVVQQNSAPTSNVHQDVLNVERARLASESLIIVLHASAQRILLWEVHSLNVELNVTAIPSVHEANQLVIMEFASENP